MKLLEFRKKRTKRNDFHQLIESHLDGMFGVALRYTRDPQRAEDLVHDTVVRALRFQERFEMGTNFKAWVYTILTRTFIHKYRRSKKEFEILGEMSSGYATQLLSEGSQEALRAPEQRYLRNIFSDDVLKALDSLPEDFRAVIVLCDIEGLSYKEISESTDSPVGTVMSRLYRGRRLLEKKLRKTAIEQGIIRSTPDSNESDSAENTVVALDGFRQQKCEA